MDLKISAILLALGISFFVGGLMFLVGLGWSMVIMGHRPPVNNIEDYMGAKTEEEKRHTYIAMGIGATLFLLGMIAGSYGY